MEMNNLNISGTLNVFRLLARPSLCLPHATISTFNQLPLPLNQAFSGKYKNVDIRAVVLDKDNCFAYPHANEVYKPYNVCLVFSYSFIDFPVTCSFKGAGDTQKGSSQNSSKPPMFIYKDNPKRKKTMTKPSP